MSEPIKNLMKMEKEECPYIGENTQCEEFQGIKCLILKHRDCETYKKLEESKTFFFRINDKEQLGTNKLKVINSNSGWRFWDLFEKTVENLQKCRKDFEYERAIIRFLERLPSGDYSNIRKEWNERE